MKKIVSVLILALFVISCSEENNGTGSPETDTITSSGGHWVADVQENDEIEEP